MIPKLRCPLTLFLTFFSFTVLSYFLSPGQKRDVNIYSSAVILFSHNKCETMLIHWDFWPLLYQAFGLNNTGLEGNGTFNLFLLSLV